MRKLSSNRPSFASLLAGSSRSWASTWRPEWKSKWRFVPMTCLINGPMSCWKKLNRYKRMCRNRQKKTGSICGKLHWSPLTAKMPAILTMPFIARKPPRVGNCWLRLPMSRIMCRLIRRWIKKPKNAAPRCISLNRSYPCCRRFCPMACARLIPR